MYDDLVKRLREDAEWAEANEWETPITLSDNLYQAADAIEELQQIAGHYEETAKDYFKDVCYYLERVPKWIPVEERLPKEYKDVLCYYEYFRYGDYNCMFRTIDRGYYGDGRWGGEAGQGHKNKVLAWMPLPQPPKEEIE